MTPEDTKPHTPDTQQAHQCLLVLGMHRSGTSMLTRLLNMAGFELPKDLLGADLGNDTGHWEPRALMIRNQEFLNDIDTPWNSWGRIDLDALPVDLTAAYKWDLRNWLATQRAGRDTLLIKEPRMCRLAPAFLEVLKAEGMETRIILPLRNPMEVARSLQRRDELPLRQGALLWLRHVLDAERTSRGYPRSFVEYEALLADYTTQMQRMAHDLKLPALSDTTTLEAEAQNFVSHDHRHHSVSDQTLQEIGYTAGMVRQAYSAMRQLCLDPEDSDAMAVCDTLSNTLNDMEQLTLPLLRDKDRSILAKQDEIQTLRDNIVAQNQRSAAISARSDAISARSDAIAQNITTQTQALNSLKTSIAEMARNTRERVDELSEQLAARDAELDQHKAALIKRSSDLSQQKAALAARTAELDQNKTALAARTVELNQHKAALASLRHSSSWRVTAPLRALGRLLGRG